jgi:phosphosulfolactate synthase (CoM biosynthesis protein A)
MNAGNRELAFSKTIPIREPMPKPRKSGLTEVRSAASSLAAVSSYVDTLAPYLDSVKWTCGTQRLMPRETVKQINDYLHANQIEVSSGGLIETVMPLGEKAVRDYLEESKELGFDIIEISSAFIAIPLEEKCNIVRYVNELGLKAKPEVNAWSPMDRGHMSADKVVREAEAVIEAGAWKVMIEEDGIFSSGNQGNDPKAWNRDMAWRIASRIPQDYLYWEASDVQIILWLINSFGPEVNIFSGDDSLAYIAAFRSGTFVTRIGTFGAK